jgi:hypothetical protein
MTYTIIAIMCVLLGAVIVEMILRDIDRGAF